MRALLILICIVSLFGCCHENTFQEYVHERGIPYHHNTDTAEIDSIGHPRSEWKIYSLDGNIIDSVLTSTYTLEIDSSWFADPDIDSIYIQWSGPLHDTSIQTIYRK